jgi:hypothetical protein
MVRASRVWCFYAATAVVFIVTGAAYGVVSGTFTGTVKDSTGAPLIGAVVTMVEGNSAAAGATVLKEISTDKKGRFELTGIAPGHYAVKVAAAGFVQSRKVLDITPGAKVNLDFSLRRENRLVDNKVNDDYEYKVRVARRNTMQIDGKPGDGIDTIAAESTYVNREKTDKIVEHGFLQFYSESTPSVTSLGNAVGVNFAATHTFNRDVQSLVFGQIGTDGRPKRFETTTSVQAGDNHKLEFNVGFGQVETTASKNSREDLPLRQLAFRATDAWRIKGPAILVFGFDYAHFNDASGTNVILPRIGFQFNASQSTKLVAELTPGSSTEIEEIANFEGGQAVFTQPQQMQVINHEVVADRSRRLQFSVEHILSKNSSVEATVFYDTISGHGVGLLAIPVDSSIESAEPQVASQYGTARGSRVVYTRRFGKAVTGSLGYAFGQGQRLSAEGLNNPSQMFQSDIFQVAVAKIDVDLHTGTKISTVLRFSPGDAVFAIDPFQGRLTSYDPSINVFVEQQIPNWSLLPGHWEATVTLLNLLDQQTEVENDINRLIIGRSQRTIRGGLTVRF